MSASPLALFDIGGRSALVTGATGAFGQAASKALAAAGARVTVAGGNAERLTALAAEIADAGGDVEPVARRPETEEDAEAIVDAAVAVHGGLDIVVTASGTNRVGFDHGAVRRGLAGGDRRQRAGVVARLPRGRPAPP